MSEVAEIARSIKRRLLGRRIKTFAEARDTAARALPDESMTLVDRVALELWDPFP